MDELMRTALGPLADDDEAMGVLRAVIHPEFFDNVRAGKRSMSSAGKEPWGNNRRDEGRRLIGHEVYHGARREQDDRCTERRGPLSRSLIGTLIVSPSGRREGEAVSVPYIIARMNRRLVDVVDDMHGAALGDSGRLAKSVRQAALSGDALPAELAPFVAKVRDASYRVTDEDFNALTAVGLSEDEIFELTVAAAVGASADLVESALSALKA